MAEQERVRLRTLSELQRQLDEAQATIRRLTRELAKEQARHAQTTEAYTKTVSNMVEVARENALLSHELERLKRNARSEQAQTVRALPFDVTPAEANVIRKAMARLHHPDVGGDEQRMKVWNALLDQLDATD
jgi:ATP/maltotriose-dependent transcriptional regulator MalT